MGNKPKNTIIVGALFCCGKTYLCNHNNTNYTILDLDEEFEPKGENDLLKTTSNSIYFERIKQEIGHYDFIFLPIKDLLFRLLMDNNIPYVLVYPEKTNECMLEWKKRNINRRTEWLWNRCEPYWNFILNDKHVIPYAKKIYSLREDEFLSDIIDLIFNENQ